MYSVKMVCVALIAVFFLAPAASAEEHYIRNGFWGGIDAGAGLLQQSFDGKDEDDTFFFLGFKGGYTINPHFLIGLELSGWLLERSDFNDSDKGKESLAGLSRKRTIQAGKRQVMKAIEGIVILRYIFSYM